MVGARDLGPGFTVPKSKEFRAERSRTAIPTQAALACAWRSRPGWHCLPGGSAPMNTSDDIEALRRRLRFGTRPTELLASGDDVVLRWQDRKVTRDELRGRAEEIAGGLHGLGVKPGDRLQNSSSAN